MNENETSERYTLTVINPQCVAVDDTERPGAPWAQRVAILQGPDALLRATDELERINALPTCLRIEVCAAKLPDNAACGRATRYLSGGEALLLNRGHYSGWYHVNPTVDAGHFAVPASMAR